MSQEIIYAENQVSWIRYNPDDVVLHLKEKFDDYPNRRWYEKGIYYEYDLIVYKSKSTNTSAVMISFWDISGKIISCPDCAMIKKWFVHDYPSSEDDEDHLRLSLVDMRGLLPYKIFAAFCNNLKELKQFNLYKESEIKTI